MPKNLGMHELILKELENGELSRKKILSVVLNKTDTVSISSARKGLNKKLYELLKDGSIAVVGYDLSLSENVNGDGMIFASIKFGPTYLIELINSVLKNNIKKDNGDCNKLRAYFIKKIKELEDESIREWDSNINAVKNRKLEFHEMLRLEAILDINSQIKENPHYVLITPSYEEIKQHIKENYREKTQDIAEKYENKLLWYIDDEEPDILKVKSIKPLMDNHIFDIDQITKEDFLIKTGLYKKKPDSQSEKEINYAFEQTLLYINSRSTEEKNDLIYRLAYSLGSGKLSNIRFQVFTEEIKKSNKTKLDDILDILER